MSDIKISALAALGAAPAAGDLFVIVDISDTSMAASGTDKNMTVTNLFQAVPVAAVFTSTVGVTGNFAIATNKFTVTAASGNVVSAGTITSADTVVMRTTGTLTDAAGSSAGTLTNAPAVGDPDKFITVVDGAHTYAIPAWQIA